MGAPDRSRRPRVLPFQRSPRSRVAALARAEHGPARAAVAARAYPNEPAIITGDFNVGEANPALTALSAPGPAGAPLFVDTYRVRFPQEKEVGTFNGFKFGATTGDKIDYIFVQPGTDVLSADDRAHRAGTDVSVGSLPGDSHDSLEVGDRTRDQNWK